MPDIQGWLVVDPSREDIKFVKRSPSLVRGQAAFPIRVLIPDSQRRIFTDKPITLTMPGWSAPTVEVGDGESIEESEIEQQ